MKNFSTHTHLADKAISHFTRTPTKMNKVSACGFLPHFYFFVFGCASALHAFSLVKLFDQQNSNELDKMAEQTQRVARKIVENPAKKAGQIWLRVVLCFGEFVVNPLLMSQFKFMVCPE